jgi:hypothetical protein
MQLRKSSAVLGSTVLGMALSGCVVPLGPAATPAPNSARPSASASSVPPSATPSTALTQLGPDGVGALTLGMTKAQVNQTSQASGVTGEAGSCGVSSDGRLLGAQPADVNDLDGKLFFSTSTGKLVIVGATSALATPEGVHLGSTYAQVKKAYPKWQGSDGKEGVDYVKVPGNADALYRIAIDAGQVLELTLQTQDQDCAE